MEGAPALPSLGRVGIKKKKCGGKRGECEKPSGSLPFFQPSHAWAKPAEALSHPWAPTGGGFPGSPPPEGVRWWWWEVSLLHSSPPHPRFSHTGRPVSVKARPGATRGTVSRRAARSSAPTRGGTHTGGGSRHGSERGAVRPPGTRSPPSAGHDLPPQPRRVRRGGRAGGWRGDGWVEGGGSGFESGEERPFKHPEPPELPCPAPHNGPAPLSPCSCFQNSAWRLKF